MQRRLPPMANHELGDEYSDLPVGCVCSTSKDVIDQRHKDEAVGGTEQNKLRRSKTRGTDRVHDVMLEHGANLRRAVFGVDMDRFNVAADLQGKAKSLFRDACPAVEWDDDERLSQVSEVNRSCHRDSPGDAVIVVFDR